MGLKGLRDFLIITQVSFVDSILTLTLTMADHFNHQPPKIAFCSKRVEQNLYSKLMYLHTKGLLWQRERSDLRKFNPLIVLSGHQLMLHDRFHYANLVIVDLLMLIK